LNFSPAFKIFEDEPPGMIALSLRPSRRAAAEIRIVDQLAKRHLADFDLVVAGAFHLAAQTHDARAGVVRRAELRVFCAAHRDDVLHVAKRLDVVDDRRAHVEPEHGREIRRLDARIRTLAFERFDEAGFLAANVSTRAAMDVNLQIVTATENVFAEETFRARFLQRRVQQLRALGHFATDVDVGELHVVREARDDHPLDELMRIFVDDLAILERAGLGFVGVADEINRLAAATVHEAPLESAREARTTATAQARELHVIANLFLRRSFLAVRQILGLDGERLLERIVAAVPQIAFDVGRVTRVVEMLQDEFELLRHISFLTRKGKCLRFQSLGLPNGVTVAQQTLNLFV
jgi:hypothetical protein